MAGKRTLEIILKASDKASDVISKLGKGLGTIGKAGGIAAAGVGAVNVGIETAFATYEGVMSSGIVQAGQMVYELGRFGAQSERTEKAFEAISGGAGAATANLDAMRRATRGAMSQTEMMGQANRLLQMGLADNAEELESTTAMAIKLGTAMGRDASGAMEDWALMMANQSIPRLDTFGISASKVRTRILELQEAQEDLTREQAFAIAVQEEGTRAMERLGDDTEDAMLQFERMEAQLADTKMELAQKVTPAVAGFLDLMNTGVGEAMQWGTRVKQAFGGIGAATLNLVGAKDAAIGLLDKMDLLGETTEEAAISNVTLRKALMEANQPLQDVVQPADDAAAAIDDLATAAGTVARKFGELEFDPESIWELARASGASLENLGELAEDLGIASDAEIRATTKAYELTEAFGKGLITVEEYREGIARAASDLEHATAMEERLAGRMAAMRGERGGPGVRGYQYGTMYHPGGMALVGEGGPEALFLPPGARVYPNESAVTQSTIDNRNQSRNYNVTINDQLAAAMFLEQARREQEARANALM